MDIKHIILIATIVSLMIFTLVFFDTLNINFNNSHKEQKLIDQLYIKTT